MPCRGPALRRARDAGRPRPVCVAPPRPPSSAAPYPPRWPAGRDRRSSDPACGPDLVRPSYPPSLVTSAVGSAVTVVMPTHNRARLMQDTLRSVLVQVGVDVRVVVVDDGSSDTTAAVLAGLEGRRIRWCRHDQPQGVSNARNTGLAMVDTPWVAFVDDDDLWSPAKIAAQLSSLQADSDARWSCTGAVVIGSSLSILRHERAPRSADLGAHVLKNNCIPGGGSGVLAATDLVRQVGGFDPLYSNLADWDMWIRLALASPATAVARPLVGYRVQASGMAHGVGRTEHELRCDHREVRRRARARGVSIDWGTWFRYLARLHCDEATKGLRLATTSVPLVMAAGLAAGVGACASSFPACRHGPTVVAVCGCRGRGCMRPRRGWRHCAMRRADHRCSVHPVWRSLVPTERRSRSVR